MADENSADGGELDPVELSRDQAAREIGSLADLEDLQRVLLGTNGPMRFRYAQGVAARTETELFGMPMPRFAIRVYLDTTDLNWVNARRIREFQLRAPDRWAARRSEDPDRQVRVDGKSIKSISGEGVKPPREVIEDKTSCIGDSVLQHPAKFAEWMVLDAELGRAYGEGREIRGTPYIKHVELTGGGLCAQAVCFMATALRHDDPVDGVVPATAVYSLSEITTLAAADTLDEVTLTGLNHYGISRFFFKSGAMDFPAWQHVTTIIKVPKSPRDVMIKQFAQVLRAYILARISVILAVDGSRLAGRPLGRLQHESTEPDGTRTWYATWEASEGALPKNGALLLHNGRVEHEVADILRHRPIEPLPHAILVVGCNADGTQFVVNDPMSIPFMAADPDQLFLAGMYDETDRLSASTLGKPAFENNGMFFPVNPIEVRLPYFSASIDPNILNQEHNAGVLLGLSKNAHRMQGLKEIAEELRIQCAEELPGKPPELMLFGRPCPKSNPSIRLVRLNQISSAAGDREDLFNPLDTTRVMAQLTANAGLSEQHWVWVEAVKYVTPDRQTIWVWDAQRRPPETVSGWSWEHLVPYLLAVVEQVSAGWSCIWTATRRVNPSVISSVSLRGTTTALKLIEQARRSLQQVRPLTSPPACDIYCFMHEDPHLQGLEGIGNDDSVPAKLANLLDHNGSPRVERIKQLAEAIHRDVDEAKFRISAFATFSPEITSPDPTRVAVAQNALKGLVYLARELNGMGHPITVIELVAGSRMAGVWPFQKEGRRPHPGEDPAKQNPVDGYAANRLGTKEAIHALCDRLETVAELAVGRPADGNEPGREQINLALELEPGPIYILHSVEDLQYVARVVDEKALNGKRDLSSVLGFNVDVGHWILAGISPKWLESEAAEPIRRRVIHAHLSAHGRGHLADGTSFGDSCSEWIRVLRRIASLNQRRTQLPNFSNFIALELEACRDSRTLGDALRELDRLLLG